MLRAPETHKGVKYRADIDGLRALAVLSVIAYHYGLRHASGGFVGVDIFFVISGYLISAIILREIHDDRFSLARFYERRIRRIFPALIVMLLGSAIAATILLTPAELVDFARTLLSALFSVSNLLFWATTSYFVADAKPLLHTWSLAVEEQFYLLFPLFLLLLSRFGRNAIRLGVLATAAASFLLSILIVRSHPEAAFYFVLPRAWELLLGVILSQRYIPLPRSPWARHLASVLGIAAIAAAVLRFSEETHFPGFAALLPCAGAALLIAAGEHGPSIVGRFLSLRPIVFVGLISYSLYLWHWPVLIFQETNFLFLPFHYSFHGHAGVIPVLFALTFLLAVLSWRFVERPFRSGGELNLQRPQVFRWAAISTAALTLFAAVLLLTSGLPTRYPPSGQAFASHTSGESAVMMRHGTCFMTSTSTLADFPLDPCLTQHPARPSILIAGDSHAGTLYPGLSAALPGVDVLQATSPGCFLSLHPGPATHPSCVLLTQFLLRQWLPSHHVDWVILSGRWTYASLDELTRTIEAIQQHGNRVLLVGPNPEFDAPEPRLLANAARWPSTFHVADHFIPVMQQTDADLSVRAASRWHIPYASFYEGLCPSGRCPILAAPETPLLCDPNHLTRAGSALFAAVIVDTLRHAGFLQASSSDAQPPTPPGLPSRYFKNPSNAASNFAGWSYMMKCRESSIRTSVTFGIAL